MGQVTICKSQNKTRLSSKRFRSCFTNKPPDGATSGFARLLDKSSIVGMNINISTFFESFILKKHKSHSALILYSQSEMCCRFMDNHFPCESSERDLVSEYATTTLEIF